MNWADNVKTLLLIAAALNLAAVILSSSRPDLRKWSLTAYLAGTFACIGIFIINWVLAQAPPFGNMHQVMSFLPIILAPLYFYVSKWQNRAWLLGYFAATACLYLIGAFFMPFQSNWVQMPALQSVWFVPHVAAYILSYALATVGTLLAAVACFRKADEEDFTNAAFGMVLLAFPFMTFGLWSGALWADEVWGGYWAWDIKEVWSLITWGLYIIYFHIRSIPGWSRYQRVILFIAFGALLVTFFIVNLMPKITSMHSYAT